MPRQRHVAKIMPLQLNNGAKTFLKQKNFAGMFLIFFLQGQKSKCAQITGTNCIFKPLKFKSMRSN